MKSKRNAMVSKSIMAHRVYNFFHCYHGALIISSVVVLIALVALIIINPLNVEMSSVFEKITSTVAIKQQENTTPDFISQYFQFFKAELRLFYIISIIALVIGVAGTVVSVFLRSLKGFLSLSYVAFLGVSAFLVMSFKSYSGEDFMAFALFWVLLSVIIMVIADKLLKKGEALLMVIFCGVVCFVVGFFCVAFGVVFTSLGGSFNAIKLLVGAIMAIFAVFQFMVIFARQGSISSDTSERERDILADMTGDEYIEGISGR